MYPELQIITGETSLKIYLGNLARHLTSSLWLKVRTIGCMSVTVFVGPATSCRVQGLVHY